MTGRWLTSEEKQEILQGLVRSDLDPGIAALCEDLNLLEGVCTLFSCSGHEHQPGRPSPGYLVLRLSEAVSSALDHLIVGLVAAPEIIDVSKIYRHDAGALVEWFRVSFLGAAHGQLDRAAERILSILAAASLKAASHQADERTHGDLAADRR